MIVEKDWDGEVDYVSNDDYVRELCRVANGLLMGESMPESWKRSTVVPLYKGKGNVLECGNYRTMKLLEHGLKGGGTCVREKIEKDG